MRDAPRDVAAEPAKDVSGASIPGAPTSPPVPVALCPSLERLAQELAEVTAAVGRASEAIQVASREQADLRARLEGLRAEIEVAIRSAASSTAGGQGASSREGSASLGEEGGSGFRGSLSEITVWEVIELIRTTKKTGVLRVKSADFAAEVRFLDGEARYAAAGQVEGFDAFSELMCKTSGYLRFQSCPVDGEVRNLTHTTLKLMMKTLCLLDERNSELRR